MKRDEQRGQARILTLGGRAHLSAMEPTNPNCHHESYRCVPFARAWAASALALLLAGFGGATPAAGMGLNIGTGSTVQLGDAVLALGCNDVEIEPTATLAAEMSTIHLAGNWDNRGTFAPGTGAVVFEDGCGTPEITSVLGDNTFFDLVATTSTGKTVRFEAGATQTILNSLTLTGAPGNLLVIRSTVPGQRAFLDLPPTGSQNIGYVDVADNGANRQLLAPGEPEDSNSVDSGNNQGWFFVAVAPAPAISGFGIAAALLLLLALARRALGHQPGMC